VRLERDKDTEEWVDANDSSDSSDSFENDGGGRRSKQFTHKWRERFLRLSGLSLRRPHSRRRPKPDDAYLAEFLTRIELAGAQFPRDRILNVDETSWKSVNNRMVTVAKCGSDNVACEFEGDVKGCLTVIAAIDATENRLPLWVICRGKTIRCEAHLREHFDREMRSGRLFLTHQENGWTNATVAREYLDWISARVKGQPLFLVWDCFSAHRDRAVKVQAVEAQITFQFVPAGLTDEWQPLDVRIFGSLNMRARALFDAQWIRDGSAELTVAAAISLLLSAWGSITQEEVLGAWEKLIPLQ
jgi:hypothetical protein